jgi:hypothetical protein
VRRRPSEGNFDFDCLSQESGKCKMTFKGHTDYLHSIAVREANHQVRFYFTVILPDFAPARLFFVDVYWIDVFFFQVVTGSEDGTARIWGKWYSQFEEVFVFVFGGNMAYSCSFSS